MNGSHDYITNVVPLLSRTNTKGWIGCHYREKQGPDNYKSKMLPLLFEKYGTDPSLTEKTVLINTK